MGKRPRADFSQTCNAQPRAYDGLFVQDAACATPGSADYKAVIAKASDGFLAFIGREQNLRREDDALVAGVVQLLGVGKDLPLAARAQLVNHAVNSGITYQSDMQQFGVDDRWQSAAETLKSGKGDCEDIALLKMALLEKLGFAKDKMWLATGVLLDPAKPSRQNEAHATLVVELEGRPHVLDNFYRKDAPAESALPTLDEFSRHTKFMTVALMNNDAVLARSEAQLQSSYGAFKQQQQLRGVAEDAAPSAQPAKRRVSGPNPP